MSEEKPRRGRKPKEPLAASELARNLYAARAAAGLSVTDLSRLSGVGESAIRHCERGQHTPSVLVVARIAQALGRTVDELLPEEFRKILRK